jgi:mersacidin/lichenicidin family type 2 lantibiotic
MTGLHIARAWKDAEYRHSLSAAERAVLPDNPAGAIELTDTELDGVLGGMPPSCNDCSANSACNATCDYFHCSWYVSCDSACVGSACLC